jgi:outer membrane lipoprotein-sorting protein
MFSCVQDELKVMEEVKAKQEKEDEKKFEESESGSVSLKSPGKVRRIY